MIMPKIVYNYFKDIKSLGEPPRLLLAYSGEEWTDNRITDEEWPSFKPSTPLGTLPVLEIDGKKYTQSLAITRYLGQKFGLGGKNIEEEFEIDQNVLLITDLRLKAASVHYEEDQAIKDKKHKEYSKTVYPLWLSKLDEIIKKNNGHVANGKLTWADFILAGKLSHLKTMLQMPDLEKKYPGIKQVNDTVYSIPNVKAYVDRTYN